MILTIITGVIIPVIILIISLVFTKKYGAHGSLQIIEEGAVRLEEKVITLGNSIGITVNNQPATKNTYLLKLIIRNNGSDLSKEDFRSPLTIILNNASEILEVSTDSKEPISEPEFKIEDNKISIEWDLLKKKEQFPVNIIFNLSDGVTLERKDIIIEQRIKNIQNVKRILASSGKEEDLLNNNLSLFLICLLSITISVSSSLQNIRKYEITATSITTNVEGKIISQTKPEIVFMNDKDKVIYDNSPVLLTSKKMKLKTIDKICLGLNSFTLLMAIFNLISSLVRYKRNRKKKFCEL